MKYIIYYLFLTYSFQQQFYYPQIKDNNENIIPIQKELNDPCDGLKKGDCMLEPNCGWCMQKQKCVHGDEKIIQYCSQYDTYIFNDPGDKYDPYSFNHNVHYNSKKNIIEVNGNEKMTEIDPTQNLPGITIKTKRK